jgi:hypothetical protein
LRYASISGVIRFAAVAAVVTLVGCAGGDAAGTSSAPPTVASASTPVNSYRGSEGHKKIGPYVWVWHTVKLAKETTIEANCPVNYAVIGGGFRGAISDVHASFPDSALTGWVVSAYGGGQGTVYAGCAPVK